MKYYLLAGVQYLALIAVLAFMGETRDQVDRAVLVVIFITTNASFMHRVFEKEPKDDESSP